MERKYKVGDKFIVEITEVRDDEYSYMFGFVDWVHGEYLDMLPKYDETKINNAGNALKGEWWWNQKN